MKKSKIIIYAVVGLCVFSFLSCIFSLLYSAIERISTGDLNARLKDMQRKGAEVSAIEVSHKNWKNIDNEFDRFKKEYLMTMDDYSKLRSELIVIIAKNQLQNIRFAPKYKPLFKEFIQVDIILTVKGTYSNIKRLIHEILSQSKIIVIRNIDLTKDKQTEEVSGDFKMEVYLVR
jgi:Tfp pilus assembly protein PilO